MPMFAALAKNHVPRAHPAATCTKKRMPQMRSAARRSRDRSASLSANPGGSIPVRPRAESRSREDNAEAVAELGQVRRVDRPVAVEIQIRRVVRIRGDG